MNMVYRNEFISICVFLALFSNKMSHLIWWWWCVHHVINTQMQTQYTYPGQKFNFYFRGLFYTSHWLNLQHWTGFYIAVYGDFQGRFFFIFEGSFLHFGGEIARSPHVFFSCTYHTHTHIHTYAYTLKYSNTYIVYIKTHRCNSYTCLHKHWINYTHIHILHINMYAFSCVF